MSHHCRAVWENNFFLGMLLVLQEIIATTYSSLIFKTHVFSLYSHLYIYVSLNLFINESIKLPIYTRYVYTGCRWWLRAIRGAPDDHHQVNSEIHSKAMMEPVWRCTWTSHNCGNLEAVIERLWRNTWRPWLSELRYLLRGHHQTSFAMLQGALIAHRLEGYMEKVHGRHTEGGDLVYLLVYFYPYECNQVTFPVNSHGELAGGSRSCREACQMPMFHSVVNS